MDVFPADNDDEALAAEETDKDDAGGDLCRICRSSEGTDGPLRYGCACRGSNYFHEECLRLSLDSHGNKPCKVCRRSYSFVPVYSENAPEKLPWTEFLRGLSVRALRIAAYVFVILFNAFCQQREGLKILRMKAFLADNDDDGGYDEALAAEETDKDDADGRDLCRICRSPEGPDDPLRNPCACRGSKYFHQECLRLWLDRHGNKQCEVCRRSYSFVPVYSEKALEKLPWTEFLRGLSVRALRIAAYVFVILFNAFCFSLHPWAAIVKQSVSEKFAFLLAVFFYNGLIVYAMTMMAVLRLFAGDLLGIHREVCVESDGLGVVAAGGFWKYMGILCDWWHDHITRLGCFHILKAQPRNPQLHEFGAIRRFLCLLDDNAFAVLATSIYVSFFFVLLPFMMGRLCMVAATQLLSGDSLAHEPVVVGYWTMLSLAILIAVCSLVRFYGSQKNIDEDRFRTLRIGLMLGLAALSLFLISTISMAFLILVGWTFFHFISFIHNDLYGFWIGCSLLQVIHIMIRGTDLLLNLVLLWIRKASIWVCRRSYSFVPVYSEKAPERLTFRDSLRGMSLRADKKRDSFPRTRGKTVEQEVARKRKWRSDYLKFLNIRKALRRQIEKTSPCAGISYHVCHDDEPCMVWGVCGIEPTEELLLKDLTEIGGPVRDQSDHDNCWTYVCGDLCSSQRLICCPAENRFRKLSARYMTFYVCPGEREYQRIHGNRKEHVCHGYPLLRGLQFIRDNGGIPEEKRGEDQTGYCCMEHPPPREPKLKYTFEGEVDLRTSNKIEDLYEWLLQQPVGADMVLFQPEYDNITSLREVYEGPKLDTSLNAGMHSVLVLKIVKINGKWAALVKLSHGKKRGANGYMLISLSTMIVNAQFSDGTSSEEEDEDDNEDEDGTMSEEEDDNKDEDGTSNGDDNELNPLHKPSYLLRHFTCPVIKKSG